MKNELTAYVPHDNIVDIFQSARHGSFAKTLVEKYSYGPLCNHWLVEKIGAFCSTAYGADVVENHPVQYNVWIGRKVLITNGSNIGNGVIAAAGAIITKDVPDYAVVAGVPVRIIRFRYSPEQIKELNKIAWWDWPDDKIRYYYEDFYEDVDVFIGRHS